MCPYMIDEIRFTIYAAIIAKVTFKKFSTSMCSNIFVQILFIHTNKIMSHVWKVFHQCEFLYVFHTPPSPWPFTRIKFTLILCLSLSFHWWILKIQKSMKKAIIRKILEIVKPTRRTIIRPSQKARVTFHTYADTCTTLNIISWGKK